VLEFQVAAVTCIGRSEFSEIVESQILHDGHFEMAGEMNEKPEMSDEEPLLPDDKIPNDHPSVGLLSLLGLIQTHSELERKSDAVLQQPDAPAPAEEINPSVDTQVGRKSDDQEEDEVSAVQFKSRNYVNIIEEYYDPDEDSDNGFEHYSV
jgi:hypothetical protein